MLATSNQKIGYYKAELSNSQKAQKFALVEQTQRANLYQQYQKQINEEMEKIRSRSREVSLERDRVAA